MQSDELCVLASRSYEGQVWQMTMNTAEATMERALLGTGVCILALLPVLGPGTSPLPIQESEHDSMLPHHL